MNERHRPRTNRRLQRLRVMDDTRTQEPREPGHLSQRERVNPRPRNPRHRRRIRRRTSRTTRAIRDRLRPATIRDVGQVKALHRQQDDVGVKVGLLVSSSVQVSGRLHGQAPIVTVGFGCTRNRSSYSRLDCIRAAASIGSGITSTGASQYHRVVTPDSTVST